MSETHEKNRITLISVAAAFVLTVLKLVVGLLTGSLGLISEAAHSGLDFVASIITFAAIRIAGRPADENHPYGHGRVENLAATVQGLLLIGTAVAIIFESVRRLVFAPHPVEASVWAFVVMTLSIVVDLWRSRLLARAARRFHSSALEADALNFRADMFSSSVVIVGLTFVAVSNSSGGDGLLARADAGAALVVAMVIIAVSGRMMFRAVNVLLDRAPITLQDQMTVAVADVPGVVEAHPVRLRESGDRLFADVVVSVPRTATLAEAHMITEQVEESLRTVESRTETVVHFEPAVTETETAADRIRAVAQALGVRTHHEIVHRVGDAFEASLHVEVPPMLSFGEAYSLSQRLVAELQRDNVDLRTVDTHIETVDPDASQRQDVSDEHPETAKRLKRVVDNAGLKAHCHEVRLYTSSGPELDVALHCDFPPSMPMAEIHRNTEMIEHVVRRAFPNLEQVVVQAEPRVRLLAADG